jgi:threonine dehydrogenase-like Zn-dependent dehydrogenase
VDGGMAEYFCHPADMLVKVPDDVTDIEAAMAEPLTISLHGIHRGTLKAGEYCAIIGAGPIGLVAGLAAEAYGAHAILLDLVQERLDFAAGLGIEYTINSGENDAAEKMKEITGGDSLASNIQLVLNNARLAAATAKCLCE